MQGYGSSHWLSRRHEHRPRQRHGRSNDRNRQRFDRSLRHHPALGREHGYPGGIDGGRGHQGHRSAGRRRRLVFREIHGEMLSTKAGNRPPGTGADSRSIKFANLIEQSPGDRAALQCGATGGLIITRLILRPLSLYMYLPRTFTGSSNVRRSTSDLRPPTSHHLAVHFRHGRSTDDCDDRLPAGICGARATVSTS